MQNAHGTVPSTKLVATKRLSMRGVRLDLNQGALELNWTIGGLGLRGWGFRIPGLGVGGLGFRVSGLGFRVQSLEFRASRCWRYLKRKTSAPTHPVGGEKSCNVPNKFILPTPTYAGFWAKGWEADKNPAPCQTPGSL